MDRAEQYMQSLRELQSQVNTDRQNLVVKSQQATEIAKSSKSETLNNLARIFNGLQQLAAAVNGDFDINHAAKGTAKSIMNSLTSSASQAVKSSDEAADRVKKYYLEVCKPPGVLPCSKALY